MKLLSSGPAYLRKQLFSECARNVDPARDVLQKILAEQFLSASHIQKFRHEHGSASQDRVFRVADSTPSTGWTEYRRVNVSKNRAPARFMESFKFTCHNAVVLMGRKRPDVAEYQSLVPCLLYAGDQRVEIARPKIETRSKEHSLPVTVAKRPSPWRCTTKNRPEEMPESLFKARGAQYFDPRHTALEANLHLWRAGPVDLDCGPRFWPTSAKWTYSNRGTIRSLQNSDGAIWSFDCSDATRTN